MSYFVNEVVSNAATNSYFLDIPLNQFSSETASSYPFLTKMLTNDL